MTHVLLSLDDTTLDASALVGWTEYPSALQVAIYLRSGQTVVVSNSPTNVSQLRHIFQISSASVEPQPA